MKSSEMIQTLFAYHYELYDRVWDSIDGLTKAQFMQEDAYSRGSLHHQMLHVANADGRWLRGLQGDPEARQYTLSPADYPTRVAVRQIWDETRQAVTAYVAALTDDDLAQMAPGMMGPNWQVLVHIVNHGTDHRAQILRQLHDLGAPTFDQDLILHLWRR